MYLVYPENHPVEGISICVKRGFFSGLSRSACMGILRSRSSITRFSGTVAPHWIYPVPLGPFLKDILCELVHARLCTPRIAVVEQQTRIDKMKLCWTHLWEAKGRTAK